MAIVLWPRSSCTVRVSTPATTKPKFHEVPESILLISRGIAQTSLSDYWDRPHQFVGPCLHRRRLQLLLEGQIRLLLRLP